MEEAKKHVFNFKKEYDQKYGTEKGKRDYQSNSNRKPDVKGVETVQSQEGKRDREIFEITDVEKVETQDAQDIKVENEKGCYMCKYFEEKHLLSYEYRCASPGNVNRYANYSRRGDGRDAQRFQQQCRKCNANGEPSNCEFYSELRKPEPVEMNQQMNQQKDEGTDAVNDLMQKGLKKVFDIAKDPVVAVVKTAIDEIL